MTAAHHPPDLTTLHLDTGRHSDPKAGMCLMEAAAVFSGEPFTDHPSCVSPVLISFGININDTLGDERRQQLKRFIPLLPGTAGDGFDEARGFLALDWLIRTYTPAFLDLRPELASFASALRGLSTIVDLDTVRLIHPVIRAARDAARVAAGNAAGAAAWDVARDAAGEVAGDAARAAAWDAAGNAAWDAAGNAAWDAAGNAAWDAARAAARAAAWAAAGAAAWAAAWDPAWDPARDAARDALQPTVDRLQESAIDLYARMIDIAHLPH